MIGIDQFMVLLWFLPVIFFIILPLLMACFNSLYSMLGAFKPKTGNERKPIRTAAGFNVSTST